MHFTPDNFSITAPDNSLITVTEAFILNDGVMATTQSDTWFTIPARQVRLIVNGYVNGVEQSAMFVPPPDQDVSGFYVPSTGEFGLSAHLQQEGWLDLEFNLRGVER